MSWLVRSMANSLRLDDDDDEAEENDVVPNESNPDASPTLPHQTLPNDKRTQSPPGEELEEKEAPSRGVKEDFTEFKQTITRQFWDVASFLAPPVEGSSNNLDESGPSDQSDREDPVDSGIGDSMASNCHSFGSEEKEGENREDYDGAEEEEEEESIAVGITDEVLAFARNIGHHPETWLDFPLDEEEDLDGTFLRIR